MRADGRENMPHWDRVEFVPYCERYGYASRSPEDLARVQAVADAYAARASEHLLPVAVLYQFPIVPDEGGGVVILSEVRARKARSGGG